MNKASLRPTNTLAYTSWSKPSQVQDAAGHQFTTSFDLDGNVQTVIRTDTNPYHVVANYTYGTSGISNGQPTSIIGGLTGVTDSITYQASGPGIGQVASTSESSPTASYTVSYVYNSTGDRWQTTYSTPNGTKTWEYDDYETVGETSKAKRVFQTLTLLQSGQPSAEQMQYAYGSHGALRAAAFAQTPASGFTPSSGSPWYDSNHLASVRARAWYAYDPGGRVVSLQHYWVTWNSGNSSYSSEAVLDNECSYEYSGVNRGLKTSSSFYKNTSPGSPNWTLDHMESYSYDPNLDYLTGANYGDGLPNATPTWSYDAAANRTDTVADNLNRPITIGGVASTSDILGNRLTLGSQTYGWDCLNRMTSYGSNNSYVYRADGMRVSKQVGSTASKYFYDGKKGFEDQDGSAGATDYGLGARGTDYIAKLSSGVTTIGFPIYDVHGNMVACLFRAGGSYSLGNLRSYDAWGVIRSGSKSGDPKNRYCASLGHKQDDESGLVYMRSRYFDSSSGSFLSEDQQRSGKNWFSYASDNPINRVDLTGCEDLAEVLVASSEDGELGNFVFDRWAIGVYQGAVVSIQKFVEGLENFATNAGSSEICFRFTSMTPGGAKFVDELLDVLGDKAQFSTDNAINQILWTIDAMDGGG